MKKIILTIAFLPALGAPLEAQAISAEQLIHEKQSNASRLQQDSAARINQLRNSDSNFPVLEGSFNKTSIYELEPASGNLPAPGPSKPSVAESSAESATPTPQVKSGNAKPDTANTSPPATKTEPAPLSPAGPGVVVNANGVI